ncbi:hypothetical protein BYT27DRAFT_7214003 [Phlegmacium glaucopus]|nr:hypothetical protein BYT27DRAFT_7214003 [Phlegmacium glaucopus]
MPEFTVFHSFFRPCTGRLRPPDVISPPNLTIITTHHPTSFLNTLHHHCRMQYLILRRPFDHHNNGYILEQVYAHRAALKRLEETEGYSYSQEEYNFFGGVHWPNDLLEVDTMWRYDFEFEFTFPNLRLLNLSIEDAVLWLIPILRSATASPVLRRVIIRHCNYWNIQLYDFPFGKLDEILSAFPMDSPFWRMKGESQLCIAMDHGRYFPLRTLPVEHKTHGIVLGVKNKPSSNEDKWPWVMIRNWSIEQPNPSETNDKCVYTWHGVMDKHQNAAVELLPTYASLLLCHLRLEGYKPNSAYLFTRPLYIILRRPINSFNSGYILERVHLRREVLLAADAAGVPYTEEEYSFHGGVYWPENLRTVRTMWQSRSRFTFTFPNLRLLNMGIKDAVLWLVPILRSTTPSEVLRRVIIRDCDSWNMQLYSFPFQNLDNILSAFPMAKMLIGWASENDDPYIGVFRRGLPTLENEGRIEALYIDGPRSVFTSAAASSSETTGISDGDNEEDVGREEYWIYDGSKDPFGCI